MTMPRQPADRRSPSNSQLALDFEEVIKQAEVLSRDEVAARSQPVEGLLGYDPVAQTSHYMQRAVQFEEAWETTIENAREQLLNRDARELYLDFLSDLTREIEQGSPRAARLADLLESVAIRGLGMTRQHLSIAPPSRGGSRWRIRFNADAIEEHLSHHIEGGSFLNRISANKQPWGGRPLRLGASDVSQHRSAGPVPARFFKRSVPFVLNNAAGTLFSVEDQHPRYENVFNPKPNEELLRWMLIDPSYQDDLEPEDYERCLASAMDVGHCKFDLDYLLKSDKRPDLIFRDGSLFPQDAYLDNFVILSKRGVFTREAI